MEIVPLSPQSVPTDQARLVTGLVAADRASAAAKWLRGLGAGLLAMSVAGAGVLIYRSLAASNRGGFEDDKVERVAQLMVTFTFPIASAALLLATSFLMELAAARLGIDVLTSEPSPSELDAVDADMAPPLGSYQSVARNEPPDAAHAWRPPTS
jgi:hypothetical protein